MVTSHIDFIGDIHGYASELITLLEKLGYEEKQGYYQNRSRKVFFVGDFIDRGPQIRKTLEIVKPMIDNGSAYAIIGNHEYNAICYWTKLDGKYLREHSTKNEHQHKATIEAFKNEPEILLSYIEWFKTLPIYFENEYFRVIHAHWKQKYIDQLKKIQINNFTNKSFLNKSANKKLVEYEIIECLLKGEELSVPGATFKDKDNNERDSFRIKWWKQANVFSGKELLFEYPEQFEDKKVSISFDGYSPDDIPVFFGHYWLKNPSPILQQPNVCCLDFSIAKEGILVSYQWDGEQVLNNEKFVWVNPKVLPKKKKYLIFLFQILISYSIICFKNLY